jgi:F1F0 ATPase subunit 2
MSFEALVPTIALAALMAVAGTALGLAYFACLRRTVDLFASGAGWARPVLLTLLRIAGAAGALALAARFGAPALLAAFLGFLLARAIALKGARRAV